MLAYFMLHGSFPFREPPALRWLVAWYDGHEGRKPAQLAG
jgi:hypothetical protein